MTRRLFKINSVSVLIKNAPTSSIHFDDGKPILIPHARRNSRMNSEFGNGFGEQILTEPDSSSLSINSLTAHTKSDS